MRGMNKVFLIGRVGQDPELRHARSGGQPWCSLSVATSRARREGEEWVEETDWHKVKVFGAQAENCQRFVRRGSLVAIEGALSYNRWQDEAGVAHVTTSVAADRVTFLSSERRAEEAPAAPAPAEP